MFTTGSVSTEEGDLPTEKKPESDKISIAKLLFTFTGLYERWKNEMEARRHSDRGPSDYEHDPDESRDIARRGREPDIRIERWTEGGGNKEPSWRDWVLGLVGVLIVAWLGRLSYQMDDLIRVVAKQDQDEKRIDRLETRVFRGTP
jgi:hypothetical protein